MANTILVPIDLVHRQVLDSVLATAIDQARSPDTVVVLLSVVPELGMGILPEVEASFIRRRIAESEQQLMAIGRRKFGDRLVWKAVVATGPIVPTIMRWADECNASLIVMASHDPATNTFLGSIAERVVKHAHHSVLVVRQAAHPSASRAGQSSNHAPGD